MRDDVSPEILEKELRRYTSGNSVSSAVIYLTIANLAFNFMRFHDFTGMQVLGIVRLPITTSILAGIVSAGFLSNKWPFQLKMMFFFSLFELVRLLAGFFAFPNLVLNDAWQFNTWRDVNLYLFGIMVPFAFGFSYSNHLKRLIGYYTLAAIMLSIWGITHSGHGPGGHLGDENDLCLVLIFLLPFAFLYTTIKTNSVKKLIGVFAGVMSILGIVATQSRGGFLGFVAVVFFQFILSRKKIKWIFGAAFVTLVSLPFIPAQYYKEIESIGTDAKANTGTIDERFRTWEMVIRMWKDPRNTAIGVGLENSRWNFKNYQDAGSGITKKSLLGRATHSTYFQILGDMGVWGIIFFVSLLYVSLNQLRTVKKATKTVLKEIDQINSRKLASSAGYGNVFVDLEKEVQFVAGISIAMLSSWFGVLAAALGISTAYYPTLWMMFAMTASIKIYWEKIDNLYQDVAKEIKANVKPNELIEN